MNNFKNKILEDEIGGGTVVRVSSKGHYTTYRLGYANDKEEPLANKLVDKDGQLYLSFMKDY